jgi:hypothetical protein
MVYPINITFEKFSTYELIMRHDKKVVKNTRTVIKKAWDLFGTVLTNDEICYIENNFDKLQKKFSNKEED